MKNLKAVEALNDLSARTFDAENGYKEAAENVTDNHLKEMFKANSAQRYTFRQEIKDCITNLGGTPQEGGTVAGQTHQIWMDVKSSFARNDDAAVLKEVNRGEEYALDAYNNALQNITVGTPEYDRIVAQRNQVRATFNRTQNLETIHEKVS